MNKIITLILLLSVSATSQDTTAIDTTWQKEAVGSFSFSQAHFDNWATGGENTLAYQFDLGGKLIYNSDKNTWTNTGKIAFGNSKIGDAESKKTVDELRIESLMTYLWKYRPDPYFSIKGETQLAPGYSYGEIDKTQVSGFLDPGYFTQSAGFIYNPMEELSVRFGAAVKETITKDYPSPFADDLETEEIEKTKIEPGVESVIAFSKKISEKTLINSTIDLFNNFAGFDATDVRWDTDITTQITKYINVKFNVKIFYDKDISTKRQLNQSLLLGISYTLL
ncbi:MAG: DUF3078 domain-containing protein [Candidatus Marinimicrobia bacterium]|nr:DUF3078 domain-containing protein [Candidatus Neomarinimicrobiota bacterium]